MASLVGFRPMLGASVDDISVVKFPILVSPKLDGIRAIWWEGQFYSRKMKFIPNQAVTIAMQELEDHMGNHTILNGLDGELIYGDPRDKLCFNHTTSAVMTRNAPATGLSFHAFDRIHVFEGFHARWNSIPIIAKSMVEKVPHAMVNSMAQLQEFEEMAVAEGYEGVILRNPKGGYKQGRSTLTEQGLLKLKRFEDSEAEVIGFEELMHNDNEAKLDERGYSKRSSHKANKVPMNTLGSLLVSWKGKEFNIGSGFTEILRAVIWANKDHYLGKKAKFKYLPIGVLDVPRHPVFLGWRED